MPLQSVKVPPCGVILLIGASGAGKTSFARRHFQPTEILSSDQLRACVSDDENEQAATSDAFELLYAIARKRLKWKRLCVIDATNVQVGHRRGFLELAREFQCPCLAIVLDLPLEIHLARTRSRTDRDISEEAVIRQFEEFRLGLDSLETEGFDSVIHIDQAEDRTNLRIERES